MKFFRLFLNGITISMLTFVMVIYSQEYPRSLYPIQLGNIWVTRDAFGKPYERVEIIDTGIIINNNYYVKSKRTNYELRDAYQYGFFYHRINDDRFIVWYDSSGTYINPEVKYYKINVQPGDYWYNSIAPPGEGTRHYFVIDTSYYMIFGTLTKVREIFVTDSSLYENYTYWSEEFGLLNHYVHDFELGNYIYLWGCVIDGVVYGDTSFLTVSMDEIKPGAAADYKLYQNHPNPFNPSTEISYFIPERSFVTIKVYDLLGREAARLINEEQEAGNHYVTFTADKLSSGVYLYELTAGKYRESKKMLLVK